MGLQKKKKKKARLSQAALKDPQSDYRKDTQRTQSVSDWVMLGTLTRSHGRAEVGEREGLQGLYRRVGRTPAS